MIKYIGLLFLSLLPFCLICTGNVAGTISETDSGCAVAGTVSDNQGKKVQGAIVVIHNIRNTDPKIAAEQRSVGSLQIADTTVTDQNGQFQFDSVDTGNFLIEVIHLDSLGIITPITVRKTDTLIETQSVVKPAGAIIGKIDSSIAGFTEKISILVRELGRTSMVDSSGTFSIRKLPEWEYHLSIIRDTLIDTLSGATALVPVSSGTTSRVSGLGSSSGITVVKDTSMFRDISVNTDSGIGGSIAFLGEDSVLKVRLLIGQKDHYHQVDVKIDKNMINFERATVSSCLHMTDTNSEFSTIDGGEFLLRFKIVKNDSYLLYNINADLTRIWGTIVIAGITDKQSYTPVRISGSFTADIGPEGEDTWDCDFGDTISTCWFLN